MRDNELFIKIILKIIDDELVFLFIQTVKIIKNKQNKLRVVVK